MSKKVVVIGGGPGGYVCAVRAAGLGANVTLVEKQNLGGTCLNWGCIPSKIMKNTADIFEKFSKAGQLGLDVTGPVTVDMANLLARKNKILETQRKGIAALLKNNDIEVVFGKARIEAPGKVKVISETTDLELDYDKLVIATGTEPLNVSSFAFDHEKILSSNDMLQLQSIPESMVIVGGGVIGCEFAFIFSALGTKVTVVEAMSRVLPLPSVDEEISKLLQREMKKRKINVVCDTVVVKAEESENGLDIQLDTSSFTDNPKPKKLKKNLVSAEKMAVCIGRSALSDDLGLENIGVKVSDRGGWIKVDDRLETSAEGVYAIGDILGPEKVMLAHVASHEGIMAAQNLMGQNSLMNYEVIPGAIFTMPEIGTVGLSESGALEKGYDVEAYTMNFRSLGKAQAIDEIAGMAKMIVEKGSLKVLGVHLIGAHATDLIGEATLAIEQKMTVQQIAHTIHAHPTLAEIMGELSLKACGTPIHG